MTQTFLEATHFHNLDIHRPNLDIVSYDLTAITP